MSEVTALLEYLRLLWEHDFSFEMSEDPEAWRRGRNQLSEIARRQPEVDPEWRLFNEIAPEFFRRKA